MFKLLILVTILQLMVRCSHSLAAYHDPHFIDDRSVIVQLFEWKWEDIAHECEQFLGPYGYGGVQTSPPNENAILDPPPWDANIHRPWYERYQPVSYKLVTRSGNESQFKDMVTRCNKAGVRVYPDIVINHMTGAGLKGKGTAGSTFDAEALNFEGVPFNASHFNGHNRCPTGDLNINNWDDPKIVRNCRLSGLVDLDQSQEYVRNKHKDFLNHLIDAGVAGFRVDAAKHMWPQDLEAIFKQLNPLNSQFFAPNSKPFFFHEVIDYGNGGIHSEEYLPIGRCLEFRYIRDMNHYFRKHNQIKNLHNFGINWGGMLASDDATVMIDNHDLQRGHSGDFRNNVNFREPTLLTLSTAFMLSHPFGVTKVMSSYNWTFHIQGDHDANDWIGPPHETNYDTKSVKCGEEWICEHRWRAIYAMAKFRNVANNESVTNWWDNGNQQVAFSRGNKAFVAINNDDNPLKATLKTGLEAGKYCDVISGDFKDGKCSGNEITVKSDGTADIFVDNKSKDPILAIHIKAKL